MISLILERINDPKDVKNLNDDEARRLCSELREFLVGQVSQTGGHLASNLGVVELTVAIHRVFDTAHDRLVFDVGHQCYVHKALTGRRALFDTLRQFRAFPAFRSPGRANTTHLSPVTPPILYLWRLAWLVPAPSKSRTTMCWR